jgi:hypothetical protein
VACLGVHFALSAKQERKVQSAASNSIKLMDVIEEIEEDWDDENVVETDKAWDAIHRCLSDGSLSSEAGVYPLNNCILGGTILLSGDYIVAFKSVETVRAIDAALGEIDQEQLRSRYENLPADYEDQSEDDFEYTYQNFCDLKEFFARAALNGRSVIFTVDQ